MGAEVVLQPTLTTTSDRDAELVMARANAIFNQIYVVSLNAAAPAGARTQPDRRPRGTRPRQRRGAARSSSPTSSISTPSTRVRAFGTAGVSRMWEQIDRGAAGEVELPMYENGRIQPRPDGSV